MRCGNGINIIPYKYSHSMVHSLPPPGRRRPADGAEQAAGSSARLLPLNAVSYTRNGKEVVRGWDGQDKGRHDTSTASMSPGVGPEELALRVQRLPWDCNPKAAASAPMRQSLPQPTPGKAPLRAARPAMLLTHAPLYTHRRDATDPATDPVQPLIQPPIP